MGRDTETPYDNTLTIGVFNHSPTQVRLIALSLENIGLGEHMTMAQGIAIATTARWDHRFMTIGIAARSILNSIESSVPP